MTFRKSVWLVPFACLALPALAQDDIDEESIEEIVVTGTGIARTGFETPQSVIQYSEEDIRSFTSSSQADILTQIPGISAEGGGGEVATNVFHRALPSGGQFSFTPLLYDGMPSFTTFGLNSSAFDVYYRNDLGIERSEFVSGGVSNLFGPGSVAGIVNYISKTGGPDNTGTLQFEAAEEGRFRGDYFFSGPLGGEMSDTYYALSGYYRQDEGPLKSGLDTQGFQIRGNIKHNFSDGSGSVTVYGQAIDDSVQFFLPLPVDGNSRERVNGNNGEEVFTMNTVDAIGLSYDTPDGRFMTPIGDGVVTKGQMIAAVLDKDLNDDWTLNAKVRYARYDHQFNLFLDGDALGPNTPETQTEYLTNRGIDPAFQTGAQFTYVQSGQALAASDLLFGNRTLDRWRDATDFSSEISVGRNFSTGNAEHTLTIGAFFSNSQADDLNYITTYLGDFRNAPMLVDVTLTGVQEDDTGNLVAAADPNATFNWTLNGLAASNGLVGYRDRSARRTAFYVADQMEFDRWSFDVGARVERLDGDVKQFNTASFVMSSDNSVNNAIETVSFTDGSLTSDSLSATEWAVSAGTLFRATDNINVFLNASRGFFFPQIRSVPFNQGRLASYEGEIIDTVEAGVKFENDTFSANALLFWTTLDDRRNVDFINDPNNPGNIIEEVTLQSTEAFGIEASGTWFVNDYFSLNGNITLRDHEFTKSEGNPGIVGNELRRQPTEMANLGARFNYNNFDAALFYNFHGDNFANDSNTVKLDSYSLLRLEAGYTFDFDNGQLIRVSLHVFNLTDEQGITEGSPRQGNAQSGQPAQFFVGRPILPRRSMLRVTYDF
ncbi:MAG: TonB-dependent receptor [Woeseiaceae bacterium]|nr:TonB-dependent receptor [Woeseiaceae bacterium]